MKKINNHLKYILLGLASFGFVPLFVQAQQPKTSVSGTVSIAFWNVENLYDTINDPLKDDEEFLPNGKNMWNTEKYYQKLKNLSSVIAKLGDPLLKQAPAIIGLAEIENKTVLQDLVKQDLLKKNNYQIIHYDGPDKRGVDVALLYNPEYFKLFATKRYTLTLKNDTSFATREQLVVSGKLMGEEIYFIVAHWPSRRGGAESNDKRIEAANLGRRIVDSLFKINTQASIIYMGDLNDDPKDESVSKVMNCATDRNSIQKGQLFNPMFAMHQGETGTLSYKQAWNLFDQTLLSAPLLNSQSKIRFVQSFIFNDEMVREQEGKFKGEPFRTYAGSKYLGGYSDHFAVYTILTITQKSKQINQKKASQIQPK